MKDWVPEGFVDVGRTIVRLFGFRPGPEVCGTVVLSTYTTLCNPGCGYLGVISAGGSLNRPAGRRPAGGRL
jgi:hypothetical protein